jgi:hypothetical protein
MNSTTLRLVLLAATALLLSACSPKIYGNVQLLDANMRLVPQESPQGTVINMINTTSALESASHSVTVDEKGEFSSLKNGVAKGIYKVEASRIGYLTDTQTVELGRFSRKQLEIKLKKIHEGKRKSIEGSRSDEDKIVNPGEVNIQPPTM